MKKLRITGKNVGTNIIQEDYKINRIFYSQFINKVKKGGIYITNLDRMRNMSIEEVAKFLVKFSSPILNEDVDDELVDECIMFLNAEYEIKDINIEEDKDNG